MSRRWRARIIAVMVVLGTAAVAHGDFTVTSNPSSGGSGSMGTQMRTIVSVRNNLMASVTATISANQAAVPCMGFQQLTDINGMTGSQWLFGPGEQRQFVIPGSFTTSGIQTCDYTVDAGSNNLTTFSAQFAVGSLPQPLDVQPKVFDFTVPGTSETQIAYVQNYSAGSASYAGVSIADGGANALVIDSGTCAGMQSCAGTGIGPGTFTPIAFKCTPPPTGQVTGTITYMLGASQVIQQPFTCRRSGPPPLIAVAPAALTLQGTAGVATTATAMITASQPDGLQSATITGTDAGAFRIKLPAPPCTNTQTCTWMPAQPLGASAFPIVIECTPSSTQRTAKLRVQGTAHAGDTAEADLSCVADSGASTTPSMLDFGDVKVTTTSMPQTFTITNLSATQDATVTVDTGHPDWLVDVCGATPCTIPGGGSQAVEVRFKPSVPAQNDRTLGVFVGGMQVAAVALRGNGTGSRLRVTNQQSPYVLDFGTIGLGAVRTRAIGLEADGNRSLNVAIGTPAMPFSVSTPAIDLAAGAEGMFDVGCQSATPGMFTGMVTLTPGPDEHVYAADTPKLDVRCRVANTPVQVMPDELDFGEVRRNAPPPSIQIDIHNPSASPIPLDYVRLTDEDALSLSLPNDDVLDPSETITVTLTLATAVEVTVQSALEVGVGGEQLVTPITGKVVTASARVTPTSLKLGSVCVGTEIDERVRLVNSGTARLRVQPPEMDQPFAVLFVDPASYPETGALLGPLEEATASVRLATQQAGAITGKLMWDVDAPEAPFTIDASLLVKEDGTAISPQAIGFDQVRVDERSERRTVRLENCGDTATAVQVLGISASRGTAEAWQLLPPQVTRMLEPGEKFSIEVFFAPAQRGLHVATIQLVVDGLREEVELTGEALGDDTERRSLYGCDCNTGGSPWGLAPLGALLLVLRRRRLSGRRPSGSS